MAILTNQQITEFVLESLKLDTK